MVSNRLSLLLVIFVLLLHVTSCQSNPASPDAAGDTGITTGNRISESAHRINLGSYLIEFNKENLTATPVPLRSSELHLNLTKIFVNLLGISLAAVPGEGDPPSGLFAIDFTLTHPLPIHPQFSIFDVKGIFMAPGSLAIGSMFFGDVDETRLENADGFTRWWNPTEFTDPGVLGYTDGLYTNTTAANLTASVNPYKHFADVLEATDGMGPLYNTSLVNNVGRGVFRYGSINTRRYLIQFPMDPGPVVVFGYVIDGCWDIPDPDPPLEIPDDFPIEANQPEAFYIALADKVNTLYYDSESGVGGGVFRLQANVHDWQGLDAGSTAPEIDIVRIFSPDLMASGVTASFLDETINNARYTADLTGLAIPTQAGEVLIAVKAGSAGGPEYGQGLGAAAPAANVSAWQTMVIDIPDPVCTGDANNDFGEAVEIQPGIGVEGQVCLPDDYRDFYSFTIPAVYATDGSIDFYCDAEPTTIGIYKPNEELIYEEAVSGGMVSITMNEVTLFPGDYYLRIYTANDTQVSPYYLEMNIDLVDVTPSAPVEITPDELYCEPHKSFIYSDYMISIGYRGLWVYDISDTSDPDLVYHNNDSYGSRIEYNYPYIYYGEYIASPDNYDVGLIDFTDITSPVFHHSVITVGDDVKYLTSNSEHLYMIYEIANVRHLGIYDWATNPLAPVQLYSSSSPTMDEFYTGLELLNPETSSTRLLVWSEYTLKLWDVEDPTDVVDLLDTLIIGSKIKAIKSNYSTFHVVHGDGIFDSFTTMKVIGDAITVQGSKPISTGPLSIALSGDYAYVGTSDFLEVVDISDPVPVLVNSIPIHPYLIHVWTEDDLLIATPVYSGFEIYSTTYPQLPSLLYDSPVVNDPKEIEMFGNYALVADDDFNTTHYLKVLDISDPSNAHIVEEFQVNESIYTGMEYVDGYAYVGVGWDLLIFDCTNPLNLIIDNTIDLFDNIGRFGVYRDTLYVCTTNDHILVYDVTDPTAPEYKTTKDSTGAVLSMTFNGDYMYAVTNDYIVETFSISNAWNPTSQGTYTPGEEPSWVMTQDDYLYISCDSLFEIVDISNPISPVYAGSVLGGTYDKYAHTAIDGLFAYVGGGWLHNCYPMICSLWPPDSPSIVYNFGPWEYETPREMEVQDGILYIGTSRGLRIYDLY